MKLSCTMIIRDEASTLRACLESIRPHIDELVIVDTGSVDDSPSIAREFADKWESWTGCNDSAGQIRDFSAARNHALELATGDAVCWFDGDDVVRGGEHLRKLVQQASGRGLAAWAWMCPYEYERDAAGRVVTLQWRERLVYPRTGWEWRGPVHEGLLGKAGTVATYQQTDVVTVEHRLGKPRDTARNLRILEAHVRSVGESDARSLHYLGAELMTNKRIGEAMHWFRRHAQLALWSDERCLSLMHLARIHYALGDWIAAIDWALQASATKAWPEPYWLIGMACCELARAGQDEQHNFSRAGHFLQRGFALDTGGAESLLMKDPGARYDAHAFYAPVLAKLGRVDEAIASAQAGLDGKPELQHLRDNIGEWKRGKVMLQVAELEREGLAPEHSARLIALTLNGQAKIERARAPLPELPPAPEHKRAASGKLDIIFFLGHQLEAWTPRTLEANGMGGSETMAWEMSKRLAALGHSVRVFAHCDAEHPEGNYDGVEWFDEQRFLAHLECDVLIASRRPEVVRMGNVTARVRVLWVHDVHVGAGLTPVEASKLDWIWCLSNWHKQHFLSVYPWLAPGKVEVTRNGIDVARFTRTDIKRNPHRAIYSSSPDRGLAAAVAAWPRVRDAIPDAELHVYYGFENWEKALELCMNVDHEHCGRDALNRLKLAIAKTPGIVLHGRVNQRELAEAMLGAGVWFYPTWFSETSCITAMEAQVARLWCVCPPEAALDETVRRSRLIWGAGEIADDCIEAMRRPDRYIDGGSAYSLDTLATDWEKRLAQAVSNVIPSFHESAR